MGDNISNNVDKGIISAEQHATDEVLNETEERILRAAEAEFLQKGFAGARTSNIAAAAGVNHAMLHYYFRTKDALFKRILDKKRNEMFMAVSQPFIEASNADSIDFIDLIGRVVERQFEFFAANPDLPLFMMNELLPYPDKIVEFAGSILPQIKPLLAGLSEKMRQGIENGKVNPVDPYMLLVDIISLNVMSILTSKMVMTITGKTYPEVIEMRKQENILTIKKRLLK